MHACRKPKRYAALFATLGLAAATAWADFKVTEVLPRFAGQSLAVSGALELGLTAKVEEALSKGIPIEVIIDINLYHMRPLLWDAQIGSWVLRRTISYHALSRQYLVTGHRPDPDAIESFTSLQTALANMGLLDDLKLPLNQQLQDELSYYVDVRASLDIDSLPAPLKPVAYTSLGWRLSSGWTQWNVQH